MICDDVDIILYVKYCYSKVIEARYGQGQKTSKAILLAFNYSKAEAAAYNRIVVNKDNETIWAPNLEVAASKFRGQFFIRPQQALKAQVRI